MPLSPVLTKRFGTDQPVMSARAKNQSAQLSATQSRFGSMTGLSEANGPEENRCH